MKSSLVEEAANELINMLLDTEVQVKKEDEKPVDLTDEIREKNTGKIKLYLYVYVSFACLIPLRRYCSSAN